MTGDWTEMPSGIDPDWDELVARSEGGHHAQTSRWGMVQERRGWDVTRLASTGPDGMRGIVQILTRPVRGLGRVGYLDRGPLLAGDSPDLLHDAVAMLRGFARRNRLTLLLVQPPDHAHGLHGVMRSMGFGPAHVKTSLAATTVLDLQDGTDRLMSEMKSKTRYNIRLGQRSGMTVRVGDRSDVSTFHALLEKTAQRQGFVANSRGYLEDLYDTLGPWCRIFLAEFEGHPVGGMLAMTFGDTVVYKRGAWSGEEGKRRPNEVMHWEVIRWAIQEGFTTYDFDGIEPDVARAVIAGDPIPGDALESVTRFKLGFGGRVVILPESSTYVPNRLLRFGHDHVYSRLADLGPVKQVVKRARIA